MRLSHSSRASFVFRQIQINDFRSRYKRTSANTYSCSASNSISEKDQDSKVTKESLSKTSPASINTILKNSFVKETDKPWTGEEEMETTVLRMIVDKYPPLKIKRESVKEYIDAHSRYSAINNSGSSLGESHLRSSNSHPPQPSLLGSGGSSTPVIPGNLIKPNKNVTSSSRGNSRKEKDERIREKKQSRIMNAKEAATDYSIGRRHPTKKTEGAEDNGDHEHRNEHPNEILPRSIAAWNSIIERRIQDAISAGEFKNLPYRGKPLPPDP